MKVEMVFYTAGCVGVVGLSSSTRVVCCSERLVSTNTPPSLTGFAENWMHRDANAAPPGEN